MKKSIEEKFQSALKKVAFNLQKLALRPAEVADIAWEDFENAEKLGDVVTIRIKGANLANISGGISISIRYSEYRRLQKNLKLWKKISDEYYKRHGIDTPEIDKNGVKYHPIFFNKKGKQLTSRDCANIVKKWSKKMITRKGKRIKEKGGGNGR